MNNWLLYIFLIQIIQSQEGESSENEENFCSTMNSINSHLACQIASSEIQNIECEDYLFCIDKNSTFFLQCDTGLIDDGELCKQCILSMGCEHCLLQGKQNLVTNGDFESQKISGDTENQVTPGWSGQEVLITGYDTQYLYGQANLTQNLKVNPDKKYSFSLRASYAQQRINYSTPININIGSYNISILLFEQADHWYHYRFELSFQTIQIILNFVIEDGDQYKIDDIELRQIEDCSACLNNYKLESGVCSCEYPYQNIEQLCQPCVRWIQQSEISAFYSENYISVQFNFQNAVQQSGINCEELFLMQTLSKFGEGFSCEFQSDTLLRIDLGQNYSLRNEKVQFQNQTLRAKDIQCGDDARELIIEVEYIHTFPKPIARLLAPSAVNFGCENLSLDGVSSFGRLKHQLEYK